MTTAPLDPPTPGRPRRRTWHGPTAIALIALAACGADSDGDVAPTRSYSFGLSIDDSGDEYRYVAEPGSTIDFRAGDEVTFEVRNTGALGHDLQVVAPDGEVIGAHDSVAAGQAFSVTVFFAGPGLYRLLCDVDDHLTAHSMQTFIEVADAEADAEADS